MTIANQHFVMTPAGDGADAPMQLTSVYANSPEEAVESMRTLFTRGLFEDECYPTDKIRLAMGDELPWNLPSEDILLIFGHDGFETWDMISDMTAEEARKFYGESLIRIAKPTTDRREAEYRERKLNDDLAYEREFNYGFNVLYKEMIEG
jgi:hypothetical protein